MRCLMLESSHSVRDNVDMLGQQILTGDELCWILGDGLSYSLEAFLPGGYSLVRSSNYTYGVIACSESVRTQPSGRSRLRSADDIRPAARIAAPRLMSRNPPIQSAYGMIVSRQRVLEHIGELGGDVRHEFRAAISDGCPRGLEHIEVSSTAISQPMNVMHNCSSWWWSVAWHFLVARHRQSSPVGPFRLRAVTLKRPRLARRMGRQKSHESMSCVKQITLQDVGKPTAEKDRAQYGKRLKWYPVFFGQCFARAESQPNRRPIFVKFLPYLNHLDVRKICRLSHPNIAEVLGVDVIYSSESHFVPRLFRQAPIMMVYSISLADPSLKDIIASRNYSGLDLSEIQRAMPDILAALRFLHERDIHHGRLTARNIFINIRNGAYLVTDYGLALPISPSGLVREDMVRSCAPEQLLCPSSPVLQSDIWMFGTLMIELVSGESPKWKDSVDHFGVTRTIALESKNVKPLNLIEVTGIDPFLLSICTMCLVYSPENRATLDMLGFALLHEKN